MAKIDKSQYTKAEWKVIRHKRRLQKSIEKNSVDLTEENKKSATINNNVAFVLGNGTSRKGLNPFAIQQYGPVYGCNALYREFEPDYLVCVDAKMIIEVNKTGYQNTHEVWTNPNKAFQSFKNFNYFNPSKGWSSGPTALWLAAQHSYDRIYILGFDYKGLEDGRRLNNVYADTLNYKKSHEGATFFGNWLRQTVSVIKENPTTNFFRVIQADNYRPEELNKFDNLKTITVEDFKKMFNISC